MRILPLYRGSDPNPRALQQIVQALQDGEVIIYPTDTLYALGCDALNNRAVEAVCRIKGIDPRKQRLSVVCASLSMASEYARIDNRAFRLLKECLPGPFTFILPASSRLPKVFKGRREVGLRVPGCDIARQLAEALGNPLLSASISYDPDIPDEGMLPEFIAPRYDGQATLLIDAGEGTLEPSTVVDLTDSSAPEVVRQGAGVLP